MVIASQAAVLRATGTRDHDSLDTKLNPAEAGADDCYSGVREEGRWFRGCLC